MRNAFPGTCYRCGEHVAAGEGHFERHARGWRTQHASCAIEYREKNRKELKLAVAARDTRGEVA